MTTELRAITAELGRAVALLDGSEPDRLDKAREAVQRALQMLDELRSSGQTWTVDEILNREG
jgi:hypothetical protein